MDGLNRSSKAPRNESPGLTDGVILWRLSFSGQSELWCLVFELPSGWHLVLDDDPTGTAPYALAELHADIVSLVNRVDILKASLLRCGWEDIDVE